MHKYSRHQSGMVLVISLFVLMLLAIIGAAATQSATIEEKIAGNLQNRNNAFQAAESALLAGERSLNATTAAFTCKNGLFRQKDINCDGIKEAREIWEDNTVWNDADKSISYDTDGKLSTIDIEHLYANPRYIIEEMGMVCTSNMSPCPAGYQKKYYRVTARAVGTTANAVTVLQSVYQP